MSGPLLSVGLPVYNGEAFLRQAVDSVLGQTFRDFELIISDNASTDATEEICRSYAERDQRVRYYRNASNIGAPRNFNRAFELARAPYFKWATADDYWRPEFFEQALTVLEGNADIVLCYARTTIVGADGASMEDYEDGLHLTASTASQRFRRLVTTIRLCHQHQGVIRSAVLRKTGLLRDHLGSDVNLLAELTLYGTFYELPGQLFFRRIHAKSSSWARNDMAHQLDFYDPRRVYGIVLHGWRAHAADASAIWRAPIGFSEKVALYRFVAHRVFRDRDHLLREVGLKAVTLARRVTMRGSARNRVGSTP